MSAFLKAVRAVTTSNQDIRTSIKDADLAWLLQTAACERCGEFLAAFYASDARSVDDIQRRYEAGRLLLTLAAMEGENGCDTLEALRVMGARNVDARGKKRSARYRKAGEARARPVSDYRHYDRAGHLSRVEHRVATELHALVARPDRLTLALETNGVEAVARYL